MGDKNFMEAGTEIDALIAKKNQCLDKIANVLAEACVTRAKNGKTNSLEQDISNVIKHLPVEDQNYVLKKLVVVISSQITGGKKSSNDDNSRQSQGRKNDIFAHRAW